MGEVIETYGELVLEAGLALCLWKIVESMLQSSVLTLWILTYYHTLIGGGI